MRYYRQKTKQIKDYLQKTKKIVITTYHSFNTLLSCLDKDEKEIVKKPFDFVCYDEAHHVFANSVKLNIFNSNIGKVSTFFTATPTRETKRTHRNN